LEVLLSIFFCQHFSEVLSIFLQHFSEACLKNVIDIF
jgi:hypothetical protein